MPLLAAFGSLVPVELFVLTVSREGSSLATLHPESTGGCYPGQGTSAPLWRACLTFWTEGPVGNHPER